jgi:cytochrome c-type biogenesis protein CcmH
MLSVCSQHYEEGSHPPPMVAQAPQGGEQLGSSRDSGAVVSGTIRIAPDLAARVPDSGYLFILAREGPDGGPPYAVKRVPIPSFPFAYELGPADAGQMGGGGAEFSSITEMYLVARIDQDGRVGPPQPGDMEGMCPDNPVAAGDRGRDIVVDKVH